MRYRDGRRSPALSSRSGCPLTCTFCATGSMKSFRAQPDDPEIVDQVYLEEGAWPTMPCS